jgi:hypothetical protein
MAATEIAGPNDLHRGARRDLESRLQDKDRKQKRDDERPAQTGCLAQRTVSGIVGAVIRRRLCRRIYGNMCAFDDR